MMCSIGRQIDLSNILLTMGEIAEMRSDNITAISIVLILIVLALLILLLIKKRKR